MLSGLTKSKEKRVQISIDISKTFQSIHSFGASAAWWAQEIGKWPDSTVNEMMDLLYHKRDGIGLNVIRYNLGGGKKNVVINDPLRMAETIEISSGIFDSARDSAALSIIDKAVERGAEVTIFTNSPPGRLTQNGVPTGFGKKSNLIPGKEREFAEYLVDSAEFLRKERGWNITELSPINEPQWNWGPGNGQEGCHYSPDEAHAVLSALNRELKKRKLNYFISSIDSAKMKLSANKNYIVKLLEDSELRQSLNHYAVHSYFSTTKDRKSLKIFMKKNYPDVELWMTEWTEMKNGKDTGMDSALNLAATVHEDMVITSASSWQYWIAVSPYDYRDGLLYMDSKSCTFEKTKRLWALGHWSKFISSGAKRINTMTSKTKNLLVSGYCNRDGSLVIVIVNKSIRAERQISFDFLSGKYTNMSTYETSEKRDLELTYRGNPGELIISPQTICTVLFE